MKPEMVKKWVKALRSGKYRQTRGSLKFEGAYCCLGVLNSVCRLRVPMSYPTLGDSVLGKIGLTSEQESSLITLNDRRKKSFTYIAEYLEKRFLKKGKGKQK